ERDECAVAAREILADRLPRPASIRRLHHVLRAEKEQMRILWGEAHRRPGPESILSLRDVDWPGLPGLAIEPDHAVSVTLRVDVARIKRIREDVALLVAAHWIPVVRTNRAEVAAALNRDRAAILLC